MNPAGEKSHGHLGLLFFCHQPFDRDTVRIKIYILQKHDDELQMMFNIGVRDKREVFGLWQSEDPTSHQWCQLFVSPLLLLPLRI